MEKAFIVTGLSAGDEGKGSIVDSLTRRYEAKLVVRFNGGAQCCHNVITPDNKHHTFAQFGSGTLAGADTYLSEYVLIEPLALLNEAKHLKELGISNPLEKIFINGNATIITPYHILANRIKETFRSGNRHGSCGLGIGECAADKVKGLELKAKNLYDSYCIKNILLDIQTNKEEELGQYYSESTKDLFKKFDDFNLLLDTIKKYQEFQGLVAIDSYNFNSTKDKTIIFEGAQGMLLDDIHGFAPYNTYSNITNENALKLLEGYKGEVIKLGLMRSYMARHGAGPFVTEDKELDIKEDHNRFNEWQRDFRVGHLDLVALKYAIEHSGGIDYLVINHFDKIKNQNQVCIKYKNDDLIFNPDEEQQYSLTKVLFDAKPIYESVSAEDLLDFIQNYLGKKLAILGIGPKHEDKDYSYLDI